MSNINKKTSKQIMIEKIKKEIEKSGFPLEIFVIDICSTKNTGRMPNERYIYNGKLKEMDLHAFFEDIQFESNKKPQHTCSNLIIECKKSREKPWIFFSSPMYKDSDSLCFLKFMSTYDKYFIKNQQNLLFTKIYDSINKNHYKSVSIPKCISYFEAFSNTNKSQIYDGIKSVLSFMYYKMNEWNDRDFDEFDAFTDVYYPIIVLDGLLFEALINRNNINIKERNHIQIRTTYNGTINIIDVVKKEYFEKFFEIIEQNHKEVVKAINKTKISKEFQKQILLKNKERNKEYEPMVELYLKASKVKYKNQHKKV